MKILSGKLNKYTNYSPSQMAVKVIKIKLPCIFSNNKISLKFIKITKFRELPSWNSATHFIQNQFSTVVSSLGCNCNMTKVDIGHIIYSFFRRKLEDVPHFPAKCFDVYLTSWFNLRKLFPAQYSSIKLIFIFSSKFKKLI